MKSFGGELAISIGLLALLFVIFNPWNIFMPGYVVMAILVAAIVLYVAFATFLWRENHGDEREAYHRLFADRIAYLVGSAILLVGIVIAELGHTPPDPWLFFALGAIVIAKVAGIIYSKIKL